MAELEWIQVADLKVHPLHEELYGANDPEEMAELIEDIKTNGMLNPIIVDQDNMVISGSRRLEAMTAIGETQVPCEQMAFEDEQQRIRWLISNNKYRTKTMAARVKEARIIEHMIEIVSLAKRQHREVTDTEMLRGIATAEGKIVARDKAGEAVGLSPRTYQDGKATLKVVDKLRADGREEEAKEVEEKMNKSVSGARILAESKMPKEPKGKSPQEILYWFVPAIEQISSIMKRKTELIRNKTDSQTPAAFTMFLQNIDAMAEQILSWTPARMIDCPVCKGTMFNGEAACTNCFQGKTGLYRVPEPPVVEETDDPKEL